MSNPSFSNIDLWLFELAEGNLSPDQIEHLELFLLQHPELDIERDMWEFAKVEQTPVSYPDADSLERKRRPAALYLASLLLLLILGSSSYGLWTITSGVDTETELKAEAELNKIENLQKEVEFLRAELANRSFSLDNHQIAGSTQFSTTELTILNRLFGNSIFKETDIDGKWPINFNSQIGNNESWFAMSMIGSKQIKSDGISENLLASTNNTYVNSGNINGLTQGLGVVNNSPNQSNQSNLAVLNPEINNEHSRSYVGRDDFHTRAAMQIDYTGKHRWVERSGTTYSSNNGGGTNHKTSFSTKMKRMARMIRRMADNPIALRNSRDPQFQVPGLTSSDISFSSAGTLIATKVQAMSRIQWLGQENEQLMSQLAIDGYAYGIRGGWGIQLNHSMYDDGGIHVGQVALTYSPKFSVNNWFSIEPSVRFKMGDKLLNEDLLSGISQVELDRGNVQDFYTAGTGPIGRNLWYKDLGVGVLVNTKWFFAGVQADNLFKHTDNIYSNDWQSPRKAGTHIIATVGTDWLSRSEKLGLSPYVVYQKKENLSEAWVGVNFKWNWFNLGLATSQNLDPSASIGMKFEQFSLHYNADFTNSTMTSERALSHQVTIRVQAKKSRFGQRLIKL